MTREEFVFDFKEELESFHTLSDKDRRMIELASGSVHPDWVDIEIDGYPWILISPPDYKNMTRDQVTHLVYIAIRTVDLVKNTKYDFTGLKKERKSKMEEPKKTAFEIMARTILKEEEVYKKIKPYVLENKPLESMTTKEALIVGQWMALFEMKKFILGEEEVEKED